MSEARGKRFYGCLFCLTGEENEVIAQLKKRFDMPIISPVRQHYFRRKGELSVVEDKVFPGYLFFATEDPELPVKELEKLDGVIRLLRYDAEEWILSGEDVQMVEEFFRNNGVIGLSRGRFVDGRLQIIEGFLKPYEKDILKVDRRHNAAMIKMKLNNREVELWLGYELVDEEQKSDDD